MSAVEVTLPGGKRATGESIIAPWRKRASAARKARRPFEKDWLVNQAFAAGNQWAVYLPREHRVVVNPRMKALGRSMQVADVLTQYVWTAIGKIAADDFRPNLLFAHDDDEGQDYAEFANKAFGWGWDEEWKGDEKLLDVLLTLATFGTAGVRCRYDRSKGTLVGDVPHVNGQPILDAEQARAHVADASYYGEPVDLRPMREGAIVWETLSPWNLLPPPAVEDERNFPWEIIVRPISLDELRNVYGDRADGVQEETVEAMSVLGLRDLASATGTQGGNVGGTGRLEDHALVYTGYLRPCPDYPRGQVVVWANDGVLLDVQQQLPYQGEPYGPRSGISYFRYWKVKQRFWGRSLYDAGRDPQRTRNKRISQIDELIDRGLPKVYAEEGTLVNLPTGAPMEVIELKPGSAIPKPDGGIPPGAWMNADVELQDANIEKALGLRGVALGQTPAGVTAYSAMALLTENDAAKLDPIAKDFKLKVADLSRDSLESMRQWPDGKRLMIAGDDNKVEVLVYQQSKVPESYMVKPAKGGTLPRNQAAEVQKVADLWNAAVQSGAVLQGPVEWLEWYKRSLDAGKPQELPSMAAAEEQKHKASLENTVMVRTGQILPVAAFDDHAAHDEVHREQELKLTEQMAYGDQQAAMLAQVIQAHRELHVQQAQVSALENAALLAGQGGGAPAQQPNVPGQPGQPGRSGQPGLQAPTPAQ